MNRAEAFEKFARGSSETRAALLRACAADPDVLAIVPEDTEWDTPHRVLAAVEYLVLRGEATYASPEESVAVARERAEIVERFVREHTIQTNVSSSPTATGMP